MESRARVLWVFVALATGAALGLPGNAAAGPDPVNQPLADGCQRNPVGLLSYTSPEWVFVGGKQSGDPVRMIEGSSTIVHTADEDLPQSHTSYDLDWDVVPDPQYLGLLAGDPNANGGQGNGNFAHDADQGKLHVEWESGTVPSFAWPTEGDRVKLWGQWIRDCGHWGQGVVTDQSNPQGSLSGTGDYFLPGQVEGTAPPGLRGEQTELHPLQAIVVNRTASNQAIAPERETDVFASNDGTHALAEEQCARSLTPLPGLPAYGPDFSACVNTPSNQVQDVHGRAYDFFVPAPPKPSPGARLRYREDRPVVGSGASETVTPLSNGLLVHVAFDGVPAGDTALHAFGARYFVGWEGQDSGPTPLRFTLQRVTVNHSLDPNPNRATQTGPPPGEYNLYMNLNGNWNFIGGHGATGALSGEWAPGLGMVSDGQSLDVNRDVVFYVPAGAPSPARHQRARMRPAADRSVRRERRGLRRQRPPRRGDRHLPVGRRCARGPRARVARRRELLPRPTRSPARRRARRHAVGLDRGRLQLRRRQPRRGRPRGEPAGPVRRRALPAHDGVALRPGLAATGHAAR